MAASGQLARVYAQAHNIPDDHIIELDLSTAEQMPGEKFDSEVVLPLRRALLQRNLRSKIKCLVPFFRRPSAPLPRAGTRPPRWRNSSSFTISKRHVAQQIADAAGLAESRIRTLAPDFKPTPAGAIEQSVRRADLAIAQGAALLKTSSDAQVKQQAAMVLVDTIAKLSGPAGLVKTLKVGKPLPPLPTSMPSTQPGACR